MAIALTSSSFQAEVLNSDIPVLVDFWAEWCAPCRMLAPIVDEVSKELDGKVKVAKVNVDENPDLAQQYGIVSIPTLMVFSKGEMVQKQLGALPKDMINKMLQDYI